MSILCIESTYSIHATVLQTDIPMGVSVFSDRAHTVANMVYGLLRFGNARPTIYVIRRLSN